MFGQTISKVDNKKRLYLSPKTGREEGDIVYLVYDKAINEYKLVPGAVIETEFNRYKNSIDSAKTTLELKRYKLLLNAFSSSIIKMCKVDKQGRVLLCDDFEKEETVNIIGTGEHLVIKKK